MSVPSEPTVVGWVDLPLVSALWSASTDLDPEALETYLGAAYDQCVEYLNGRTPVPEFADDPTSVPYRFKLAQVMQARALLRSVRAGNNDETYEGVTVFPMDWTVKRLLRPARARRYVR